MNKINQVKIPFGIDSNGNLKHISEAKRGLECNCYCPHCKGPLIARKGEIQQHCFQHYSADCGKATETAIHMFIKNIISECKYIILPSHRYSNKPFKIKIDKVEVEKKFKDIVPDVILYSNNTPLFLEVCVTHAIDDEKLEKIRQYGISVIELDVNCLNVDFYDFDKQSVIDNVINNIESKIWIYNRKEEEIGQQIEEQRRLYEKEKERIDLIRHEERIKEVKEEINSINELMPEINYIKKKLNCEIFLPSICSCGGKVITCFSKTYKYFFYKCTSCKETFDLGTSERSGRSYFKNYYFKCDKCGAYYKLNYNRKTDKVFLGCSNYPKCKNTKKVCYINKACGLNKSNLEEEIKKTLTLICGK